MKTKLLLMLLVATAALFALSAFSIAADITVPNPGFEERLVFEPTFADGMDKYNKPGQEYWRHFECDNNGGPLRIWNPGAPGSTPQGAFNEGFGGNAAEGEIVVVVRTRYNDDEFHDPPQVRDFEAAVQLLDETFEPNIPYKLPAQVGRPEGYLWNGYAVQLVAGGTNVDGASYQGRVEGGTVVAQDYNTLTVAEGAWVTSTVKYDGTDPNYALAGLPLQIRLCALEDPLFHGTTSTAAFDDVKLEGGGFVDVGPDMATWDGMAVDLTTPEISSDYTGPASTYAWTADPCTSSDFTVDISDPAVATPTVTITKIGPLVGDVAEVKMTLTVDGTLVDDMTIKVYDNACLAGRGAGLYVATDLNGDCVTDLLDLAEVALVWLTDMSATEPQKY